MGNMAAGGRKKIICCGETLFDLVIEKPSGNKPMVLRAHPGGSATNTAMILAILGLPAILVSRLGTDFLSRTLTEILRKKGVDTGRIIRDAGINTPLAIANIDPSGNSSFLFYGKEAPHKDKPSHLCESPFRSASVFHTGSFFSYSDAFFRPVMKRLGMAKKRKVFITYDPNWRIGKIANKEKARERIKKILPYVDLLKLSEEDACQMTGEKSLFKALEKIGKHLKGKIIVTLGAKGSFYWDGKEKIRCPAFRVRVADTIGAGDGYTAGLIMRYCAEGEKAFGGNIENSLRFASAVSAIICTGHGAVQGLKDLKQVTNFVKSRR
jgi:fructokinase